MKNTIVGVDIGYGYTKTHTHQMFKSAIRDTESIMTKGTPVKINGETRYVGAGMGNYNNNRISSDVTRYCFLYALYQMGGDSVYAVTGLPVVQYKEGKHKLRETLLTLSGSTVSVGNVEKRIIIKDVFVYAQGLATFCVPPVNTFSQGIVVDVGSKTIDIVDVLNGEVNKFTSLFLGIEGLYSTICCVLNGKYNLNLSQLDVEHIINNGLYIDGNQVDLSFLKSIYAEHFTPLFDELSINYKPNTYPILLTGGGATYLYKALCSRYPNVLLLENGQFTNAEGYYILGQKVWRE